MQSNLHQLKYTHNIMKFKQVKLSEVANIFAGYPFKGNNYSDKGVRVVRGDNVTIGHLRWTIGKDKRWNEPFDQFEYYSLHENDIVIGMDGSRVGMNRAQIKHEDLPLLLAQRVACIRNNSNSIQDYLYYQIFSNNFVRYIKAIHTGTSIPHVSLKQIGDFAIPLPSLSDQRRIAGILSALDSKIENNNKINANLESQAQALFKSWFVDFTPFKDQPFVDSELGPIPQGWKVGTLGDIANIIMGQSPAGSSYNERGNGVIFYQGRTEFGFRFPNVRLYTTMPKRYAEPMSILLSVRAPVGDINVAIEKCCIGRGLASISSKRGLHSFLLYLVKSLKNRLEVFNGEGTVFGSINKNTLTQFKIIIPPIDMQEKFNEIIQRHDCMVLELHKEIINLSTQRDTLLPKLMSGEIKL